MAKFLRFFGISLIIIILTVLNIGLSYLLPYPFNKINILFIAIIIFILWKNSGTIIWFAFFSHLLLELFSTTPFGIILFSSTISILFTYWLYQEIFTNRSLLSTLAIGFFALFFYRVLYLLLLILAKFLSFTTSIPWQSIFITFFWEFIFTLTALAIIYFIISKSSRRFNTTIIESGLFKI
ncbi:MAG: hypothetical protein WA057_04990 [Candidatus Magasanikiibacteriota bacterium]